MDLIFKVDKNLKGNEDGIITIRTGVVNSLVKGDCGYDIDVKVGDELVLFLSDEKGEDDCNDFDYFLIGGDKGVFKVVDDKIKNDYFEFSYDDFKLKINN